MEPLREISGDLGSWTALTTVTAGSLCRCRALVTVESMLMDGYLTDVPRRARVLTLERFTSSMQATLKSIVAEVTLSSRALARVSKSSINTVETRYSGTRKSECQLHFYGILKLRKCACE